MLVRPRRPIAFLCISLLALNMVACTHTKRQEAQPIILLGGGDVTKKNIVGVTLKDGRDIRFDEKSRTLLRGDTLQAHVGQQPLAIPVTDLQLVWVQSVDNTRTSFLVLGILVAAFVALGALAASQMEYAFP